MATTIATSSTTSTLSRSRSPLPLPPLTLHRRDFSGLIAALISDFLVALVSDFLVALFSGFFAALIFDFSGFYSNSYALISSPPPPSEPESSKGLSGGQNAEIAIGVILGVVVVVLGGLVHVKRRENIRRGWYGYSGVDRDDRGWRLLRKPNHTQNNRSPAAQFSSFQKFTPIMPDSHHAQQVSRQSNSIQPPTSITSSPAANVEENRAQSTKQPRRVRQDHALASSDLPDLGTELHL
ncbi:hypothetical protein AKJ16_DCAP01878 [Drosera capensis]